MLLLTGLSSQPARADDPAFFAFSGGWFDFNRQKKESGELTVEYRDANKFWIFKPMGGIMANSDGGGAAYAGVLVDLYFGNRLVLTPSFAPGVYLHGASKDLGGPIEFRSQVELSYRFDDRSRLGFGISHMSNAHIYNKNPGTEILFINYAIPASTILNW